MLRTLLCFYETGKTTGHGSSCANTDRPKTIVVFGATGQQGGSVVKTIKGDTRFLLKAATRNPLSDKAKKLASEGEAILI